jgi:hypothetical protein
MYSEPTLKIDYESFLLANPHKRKWFFFFAGIWTVITSLALGLVGTHNIGGEMAHYNREKKIERAWRRNLGE